MKSNPSEYHFVVHTCNLSSKTKTVVNPFTGEEFKKPVDDGLTGQEIDAVREIFAAHKVEGPFDGGHLVGPVYGNEWISFHTGFELGGSTPVVAISVFLTVSDLSDEILGMILKLAQAGNLALTSQFGKFVRIIGRQPNSKELARWPDAKKLSSTAKLRDWLQNEIKGVRVSKEDDEEDGPVYFSE